MGKISLPATRKNRAGAAPDAKAIRAAVDELGIQMDIQMRWTSGQRRRGTCYSSFLGHRIMLSTHLDAHEMSVTLWHELTHAQQMEGFKSAVQFSKAYAEHGKSGIKYRNNPYEIEARINGERAYNEPLARQEARRYK